MNVSDLVFYLRGRAQPPGELLTAQSTEMFQPHPVLWPEREAGGPQRDYSQQAVMTLHFKHCRISVSVHRLVESPWCIQGQVTHTDCKQSNHFHHSPPEPNIPTSSWDEVLCCTFVVEPHEDSVTWSLQITTRFTFLTNASVRLQKQTVLCPTNRRKHL